MSDEPQRTTERSRLVNNVLWQVVGVSTCAYFSQLLIFDEANWYKIDLYDALVWGLVVTQVFSLAIYVSRYRISTVENSLSIFFCMAGLALGLTVAATLFLVVDAVRNNNAVLSLLGITAGYWVAVFVFLVSMFLQLRFAIILLLSFRLMVVRKRASALTDEDQQQHESTDRYSIADVFALTGLAAVSISAYRLVLGMVTDYDALRFLAMFYAASITAFCTYGLIQLPGLRRGSSILKTLAGAVVIFALAYAEFSLAQQLRSPLLRFGFTGMLLCNFVIAAATVLQYWNLERFSRWRFS